ncbi:hypothetical protein GCM10017608_21360 [Agromyces luteolus]|uniref:Uncharacterized protein n=1 Tax=Agromyces luteolus TaxID=88373 RepID=A0A7C9LYL4_9MICO|nr:DUF6264 family protein [Agromyces luteolus]MUN08839.1 hypothetical protein [Agromyces luteolus]GLK28202.1 hypothetical protein GCM10017608_21360 [Agromyces luteolus]
MTQDEAARNGTPERADDGAAPPPRDERPRPQYGEYAPEGWSWQPPGDDRTDAAASAPATPPPPPAATPVGAPGSGAADGAARPPRTIDRFFTILLLALGAIGAWNTSVSLQQLPGAIQGVYTDQGVGTYSPQPWLPTLALIGTVFMLALYAAVLGWSIMRLRARRLAFWVPLVGGAVAFLATMVLTSIVFFTDPTFQSYLERMTGV